MSQIIFFASNSFNLAGKELLQDVGKDVGWHSCRREEALEKIKELKTLLIAYTKGYHRNYEEVEEFLDWK